MNGKLGEGVCLSARVMATWAGDRRLISGGGLGSHHPFVTTIRDTKDALFRF